MSDKVVFVSNTIHGPIEDTEIPTVLCMEFGQHNILCAPFNWGRQSSFDILDVYVRIAEVEFGQNFEGDTLTIAGAIPRYVLADLMQKKQLEPVPVEKMGRAIQVAFLPCDDDLNVVRYHPLVFPLVRD